MKWKSLCSCLLLLSTSLVAAADQPLFLSILDASPKPPPRTLSAFPVQINFPGLDSNPETI